MADYEPTFGESLPSTMKSWWKELSNGTHALVRYVVGKLQIGDADVSSDNPLPVELNSDEAAGSQGSIRKSRTASIVITSGTAISERFDLRDVAGIIIHMPDAWTAASIGFQVCEDETGLYLPLYDDSDLIVEITSADANKAYAAPADIFAARYVRLWSQDGAGADTNQVASRTFNISLKA